MPVATGVSLLQGPLSRQIIDNLMVHAYNPIYSGGRIGRITV
jgi:hypothetical protein